MTIGGTVEDGIPEFIIIPDRFRKTDDDGGLTWDDVLAHWALVVSDMLAVYGLDLYDPDCPALTRPCGWLHQLLGGLVARDGALSRVLAHERERAEQERQAERSRADTGTGQEAQTWH